MLPKDGGELLCITKSMKDCMLLYELGIPAIAPCSENIFLTERQYDTLRPKFDKCIVLFDNDRAGVQNLRKVKKEHPELICTCIPRHLSKDISDFYAHYGKKKTISLIEQAKEYYLNGGKEKRKNKQNGNF